jgi:pyruvate-ferredoxin/flavodoxin oxidoreductase
MESIGRSFFRSNPGQMNTPHSRTPPPAKVTPAGDYCHLYTISLIINCSRLLPGDALHPKEIYHLMAIIILSKLKNLVMSKKEQSFKYPGVRVALDGNTAAIMCERESSDAAGAYPITPSTQMGEYWAEAAAKGHINISDRPLIFIEPEGEHAAAAVTAGLSMTGLRAANFSSGQGIAYMHESLYAAVGKRLTYVLNIGARAMTKSTLNVHAGHDDYHAIDDTGFFQLFANKAQHVADLNIIAHRIAELA